MFKPLLLTVFLAVPTLRGAAADVDLLLFAGSTRGTFP